MSSDTNPSPQTHPTPHHREGGHTKDDLEKHPTVTTATDQSTRSFEQTLDFYKSWSATYDKEMSDAGYGGPLLCAEYLNKHAELLGWNKEQARVLDVAAGTGAVAQVLKYKYGFRQLDAADASQAMLDTAQARDIYVNLICTAIGGGVKMPIPDDTYDATVMSGGFADGHLKCDALLEMLRVVKPGGLILNVMRDEFTRTSTEYVHLLPFFDKLLQEGKLERVEQTVVPEKYLMGFDALVQVYKVV